MAADYLLVIDGIKGESQDSKYKESIEILSFGGGVSNMGSGQAGRGTGAGTGKASFQDFTFTKQTDAASPDLWQSAATGAHIKKATLYARKASGKGNQEDYLVITLEDVYVSSFQTSGNSGENSIPLEQVSLHFDQCEYKYRPQKQDGTFGGFVAKKYNLATLKF